MDFMPQPETKIDDSSRRTIRGMFVGHHVHSGGIWSGDYLFAEYAPFRASCDVIRGAVTVYGTKEIIKIANNVYELPVA